MVLVNRFLRPYNLRDWASRQRVKVDGYWWMGAFIVEVTSLQGKPIVMGGNLPSQHHARKRRCHRGRRSGGVRVRQTRLPGRRPMGTNEKCAEPAQLPIPVRPAYMGGSASEVKTDVSNRRNRFRRKRRDWIEAKVSGVVSQATGVRMVTMNVYGQTVDAVPIIINPRKFALARKDIRKKRYPLPPGLGFREFCHRFYDMKYGTWADVSGGRLKDGEYSTSVGSLPIHEVTVVRSKPPDQSLLSGSQPIEQPRKILSAAEASCPVRNCRSCRRSMLCPLDHGIAPGQRLCRFCDWTRH